MRWGKLKIDSDHDGTYEHIIDLKAGVFDNGTFVTSSVSGGTLITFQPAGGSTSSSTGGSNTSTGTSTTTVTNTTKAETDTGTKVNGVWRYDMDTNDTAKVRATIDKSDLEIQLQWDRIKINTDRDSAYEHIIHLEGGGFDNGIFKTTAGANGTTLVTFVPAGGTSSAPSSATGKIITDSFKAKGVEYFTLSDKDDRIYIDEKISQSDLEVQLKWDKVKIDADNDGDVDYSITLKGNYTNGDFVTTSSGGGTLIGFQSDSFDFG